MAQALRTFVLRGDSNAQALWGFLTADELADVIGCASNSYACMRRHLTRNGVPFIPNLRGFPQVDRTYFEARMRGTAQSVAHELAAEAEPDFSAI